MLCANCSREYSGSGSCPHCGFDLSEQQDRYPHALLPGTVLGGQSILGRVLGQGGFGITYVAQDYDTKKLVAIKEYMPGAIATRLDIFYILYCAGSRLVLSNRNTMWATSVNLYFLLVTLKH